MPTTYIYLKNEDYAKLVNLAMDKKKKVSQLMREMVEKALEKEAS